MRSRLDLRGRPLIVSIGLVAGLAIFFFGYDQGMMSGVNTSPDYVERMEIGFSTYKGPSQGYVATITNPTKQGGVVSIFYFGALIGCLWAGSMADKIGRVKTMIFGGMWVLLGAALQTCAQNTAWMCCARIINGLGTGFLNVTVPVWSAEIARHTSRGAFIAFELTLNLLGVVTAYWLEFGLSFVGDGRSQLRWRLPVGFQMVPMIVFLSVVWLMPESPRWLVKVGRVDEAHDILERLRDDSEVPIQESSSDSKSNGPLTQADRELADILDIVASEKAKVKSATYFSMLFGIGWGDLHVARRVQLNIWLPIMRQWLGIAAITVYAPVIFSQAGYDTRKSEWLSGVNMINYMLSTLIGVVTIDRLGRRVSMWWGAAAQGAAMLLAGAFSRLASTHPTHAAQLGAAGASCIFLYTFAFAATWVTIPWVYATETFPLAVRAKGMAWGIVGWAIGNGWLTLLSPVMFAAIRENTLHVFGAVNFAMIPVVWALYPETANRTLEEVDLLFASESWWAWDEEQTFQRLKAQKAERSVSPLDGSDHDVAGLSSPLEDKQVV